MKVICVYSTNDFTTVEQPLPHPQTIPFGIASIASSLKDAGHFVRLLVLTPKTDLKKIFSTHLEKQIPELFCFTAVSTQMPLIVKAVEMIKGLASSSYVVLGGAHASLNPSETIAIKGIDAICIGEGEAAVIELANQLQNSHLPGGIPNLWIKRHKDSIEKNKPAPFVEDLDKLPIIDRSFWMPWISNRSKRHAVLVGRGCPMRCRYCSNHRLAAIASGRYVRFRSPKMS